MARALRVAGKVEPVFVDDIAELAQTIVDNLHAEDVLLCMGAGSIGAVPARLVDMLRNSEHLTQSGQAL